MSRTRVLRSFLALALLVAVAIVTRGPAPVARAANAPGAPVVPKPPSVVMQAFRQGQDIGVGPNRAGLVVRYADGSRQTRCVRFSDEEIGGDELLALTDLNPVFGYDKELCAINDVGCPAEDCFCECRGFPDCEYWAYYHLENGAWVYSSIGASGYGVKNGYVEGWSWGAGDFTQGVPPPLLSFDEICAPAAAATATATATTQVVVTYAPQASLTTSATSVTLGQCATLSWQTVDAATVTLDSVSVSAQGSQQVCPPATQTWRLVASNAVGQTVRDVTVAVVTGQPGAGQGTATATVTSGAAGSASPTSQALTTPGTSGSLPGAATPLPSAFTPRVPLLATQGPGTLPEVGQGGKGFPTPSVGFSPPALATPPTFGGVPLAPTSQPQPQVAQAALPSPTRFVLSRPPTETPRPRRVLGGDGSPTPTPILLIGAGGGSASGAGAVESGQGSGISGPGATRLVESRAFSPALLPQYAAYLATLTVLLGMGWFVARRRNGRQQVVVAQPGRGAEIAASGPPAVKNEQAT